MTFPCPCSDAEHPVAAVAAPRVLCQGHRRLDVLVLRLRVPLAHGVRRRQQLHGPRRDQGHEGLLGGGHPGCRRGHEGSVHSLRPTPLEAHAMAHTVLDLSARSWSPARAARSARSRCPPCRSTTPAATAGRRRSTSTSSPASSSPSLSSSSTSSTGPPSCNSGTDQCEYFGESNHRQDNTGVTFYCVSRQLPFAKAITHSPSRLMCR